MGRRSVSLPGAHAKNTNKKKLAQRRNGSRQRSRISMIFFPSHQWWRMSRIQVRSRAVSRSSRLNRPIRIDIRRILALPLGRHLSTCCLFLSSAAPMQSSEPVKKRPGARVGWRGPITCRHGFRVLMSEPLVDPQVAATHTAPLIPCWTRRPKIAFYVRLQ